MKIVPKPKILGITILFFLLTYLCLNLFVLYTFKQVIAQLGIVYWIMFYGPKIFPILIIGIYLTIKDSTFYDKTQKFSLVMAIGFFAVLILFIISFFVSGGGTDTRIVIAKYYSWSYTGLISWVFIFCFGFLLLNKKIKDFTHNFVYSVLIVSASSMLYEVAVHFDFSLGAYIDYSYPFFIGTEFVSLAFLLFMIYQRGWRPEKVFVIALTLFLFHSFFWFFNKSFFVESGLVQHIWCWIPRFLGASVLLSLICGIKNKVKQ